MTLLLLIALISLCSLILNYTSFLRVLLLLEVLLLVAGFYLSLSLDVIAGAGAFPLFSSLIALLLAGTEAALGVTLVLHFIIAITHLWQWCGSGASRIPLVRIETEIINGVYFTHTGPEKRPIDWNGNYGRCLMLGMTRSLKSSSLGSIANSYMGDSPQPSTLSYI